MLPGKLKKWKGPIERLVFFARMLQSWGVKNSIYIEYIGKWLKLQLFQIRNGFFKKISPLQTFFYLLYPKQTYLSTIKNVVLRFRFFAKNFLQIIFQKNVKNDTFREENRLLSKNYLFSIKVFNTKLDQCQKNGSFELLHVPLP